MIKFFRRIRRNLLEEGNLKRYFLYATGEILLVMIGILLALQVNNWNQNRLERNDEQKALLNLKKDFELNKSNLLYVINRLQNEIKGTASILNHTGERYNFNASVDLDSLLILATSTPRYFPQNGFLNELINSGKLSLIQNEELKIRLSSWETSINYIMDRTDINHSASVDLSKYVAKFGNWLSVDSRFKIGNLILPPSGFDEDNFPLLQKREFENLLDLQLVYKDGLLGSYNSALEACEAIQGTINEEIEKE